MRQPPISPTSALVLPVIAALLALAPGCKATCEDVCDRMVECDGLPTERMSSAECEESCKSQTTLYEGWTDIQKQDALQSELDCLDGASCEDIAAGVCYDEDIWSY